MLQDRFYIVLSFSGMFASALFLRRRFRSRHSGTSGSFLLHAPLRNDHAGNQHAKLLTKQLPSCISIYAAVIRKRRNRIEKSLLDRRSMGLCRTHTHSGQQFLKHGLPDILPLITAQTQAPCTGTLIFKKRGKENMDAVFLYVGALGRKQLIFHEVEGHLLSLT